MIFILFAVAQSFAQLDPVEFNRLLEQPDRPTVQQVIKALKIKPGQQNLPDGDEESYKKRFKSLKRKVIDDLPELVVSLEYFYPNGQYAFLGRDASGAADLLEAFYLSIGQRDRVLRLRSSGDSLAGDEFLKNSKQMLVDFLISNGAPLNTQNLNEERPFVIVDATSLSESSQSTRIASAAIGRLRSLGYTVDQIYSKFGVADLNKRDKLRYKKPEDLFKEQVKGTKYSYGIYGGVILGELAPEFAYSGVQPLWHKTFKQLKYVGPGVVAAQPGSLLSSEDRFKSLVNMLILYQLMKDPEVQSAVYNEASKRGLNFSVTKNGKVRKKIKVDNLEETKSAKQIYQQMQLSLSQRSVADYTSLLASFPVVYAREPNFPYAYLLIVQNAYKNGSLSIVELAEILNRTFKNAYGADFQKFFKQKLDTDAGLAEAFKYSSFLRNPDFEIQLYIDTKNTEAIIELYKRFADVSIGNSTYGKKISRVLRDRSYFEGLFEDFQDPQLIELQKQLVGQTYPADFVNVATALLRLPESPLRAELIKILVANNTLLVEDFVRFNRIWIQIIDLADLETLKVIADRLPYRTRIETQGNAKLSLLKKAAVYGIKSKRDSILEAGYARLQKPRLSCKSVIQSFFRRISGP